MIIHCPHCQTKYRLEEKPLGDQPSLQFRCNKCQETFSILLPALVGPMARRPVPVQQHDEFNKRLRTVAPSSSPDPLKATTIRGNSRPWLDSDKVVSLVVIDGPMKGQVFPVIKPRVLLGRAEADIVLEDSEISRKHCALEVHGTSAVLADLGSTNGTYVDDERIETHQLQHMSEFRLGSTVVMFSARAKE
ncbi:MAG: zinc-ribbon domain-containing protein [Acidobacteria bacterium]|nr:zinc-ribbon domain-containing protein [Acidobacteriota bacterium]MCI0621071.1 zinc-ribbon domain-containing protein [Acidobacteriota bacterium]MCI0718230.1 zinc-ribbon domain-containing protein [Acidobacteriota bacterium]